MNALAHALCSAVLRADADAFERMAHEPVRVVWSHRPRTPDESYELITASERAGKLADMAALTAGPIALEAAHRYIRGGGSFRSAERDTRAIVVPTPSTSLHATRGNGRPLCGLVDALDMSADITSEEHRGRFICPTCWLLEGHRMREARR